MGHLHLRVPGFSAQKAFRCGSSQKFASGNNDSPLKRKKREGPKASPPILF
jgi:hypothetical protein